MHIWIPDIEYYAKMSRNQVKVLLVQCSGMQANKQTPRPACKLVNIFFGIGCFLDFNPKTRRCNTNPAFMGGPILSKYRLSPMAFHCLFLFEKNVKNLISTKQGRRAEYK